MFRCFRAITSNYKVIDPRISQKTVSVFGVYKANGKEPAEKSLSLVSGPKISVWMGRLGLEDLRKKMGCSRMSWGGGDQKPPKVHPNTSRMYLDHPQKEGNPLTLKSFYTFGRRAQTFSKMSLLTVILWAQSHSPREKLAGVKAPSIRELGLHGFLEPLFLAKLVLQQTCFG